ncbi:MAG: hypothetical protein LH647_03995 [Leptolyngbyaceae cyanobacterium CAN_BIN12]|nr:hypothetical protein [Leptolyngbyaceae cyanobacterium CAN_BIN12]
MLKPPQTKKAALLISAWASASAEQTPKVDGALASGGSDRTSGNANLQGDRRQRGESQGRAIGIGGNVERGS